MDDLKIHAYELMDDQKIHAYELMDDQKSHAYELMDGQKIHAYGVTNFKKSCEQKSSYVVVRKNDGVEITMNKKSTCRCAEERWSWNHCERSRKSQMSRC